MALPSTPGTARAAAESILRMMRDRDEASAFMGLISGETSKASKLFGMDVVVDPRVLRDEVVLVRNVPPTAPSDCIEVDFGGVTRVRMMTRSEFDRLYGK